MLKGSRLNQFSVRAMLVLLTVTCVGVTVWRQYNPPVTKVLVATKDLDIKSELTKANVAFEAWPTDMIPEGAVTSGRIPTGRVTATRLRKGQVVYSEDMKLPSEMVRRIPSGFKVVSVKVIHEPHDLHGLMLRPGDRVDVFSPNEEKSQKPLLTKVQVFNLGHDPKDSLHGIVGLLLSGEDAEKIEGLNTNNRVRLVVRYDELP